LNSAAPKKARLSKFITEQDSITQGSMPLSESQPSLLKPESTGFSMKNLQKAIMTPRDHTNDVP